MLLLSTDIETYDDLIERVRTVKEEHSELPTEDQDRLLLKTFNIGCATQREMDGLDMSLIPDTSRVLFFDRTFRNPHVLPY